MYLPQMTKGSTQRGKNLLKVKRIAGVREILTKRVVRIEIADPSPNVLNIIIGNIASPINVPKVYLKMRKLIVFYKKI